MQALMYLTLAPAALMAAVALTARLPAPFASGWRAMHAASALSLLAALVGLVLHYGGASFSLSGMLAPSTPAALLACLVALLGGVIGSFSSRYLQGEAGQARYRAAFASVLAAVQLLLLADHWLPLIAAWAAVGAALSPLLCFYRDRPFALLAAHKKRLADRLADLLLLSAAALAWWESGSGSLSALQQHLTTAASGWPLQLAAVLLVLAVCVRSALLPLHGWLTQVMEAPTPVSALLHAGVVNLGGFVLIRFGFLLDAAPAARALLVVAGLATAVLAGFVMLTRVSIKLRLAWSTVAQMGFMGLECGLGLYQLALLHLLGHSLYKAHSFLAASGIVRHTRWRMLQADQQAAPASQLAAPLLAGAVIAAVQAGMGPASWPWWWSAMLALAWAPMLWLPRRPAGDAPETIPAVLAGLAMVAALSVAATFLHSLNMGVSDAPHPAAGYVALAGMALLYAGTAGLQAGRQWAILRRWSYAGFSLDERVTSVALRLWPAHWAGEQTGPALARLPSASATAP